MMSDDVRSALDELNALRSGDRDDQIMQETLDEMGLSELTPEAIESLGGSISDDATRRAWREWGPKFAKIADMPFWLIGIEHAPDVDCATPAPPFGHRMFTSVPASMPKAGWARPMALTQLTYPCCWAEMRAIPGEVYLMWPDGEITRPDGRRFVQE
jgi:hypothetical protein